MAKNDLFSNANSFKLPKARFSTKGERTLTKADKKKEMISVKHKCQKCKRTFPDNILEVHHKKGVASHKSKGILPDVKYEVYMNRRKKASYDKSSNLMVLCPTCHKIVHNEESAKNKAKKKTTKKKKNPWEL